MRKRGREGERERVRVSEGKREGEEARRSCSKGGEAVCDGWVTVGPLCWEREGGSTRNRVALLQLVLFCVRISVRKCLLCFLNATFFFFLGLWLLLLLCYSPSFDGVQT